MAPTSRLNFAAGIRSAFDNRCDLSSCLGIGDCSGFYRVCLIVGLGVFQLVQWVSRKRVEVVVASKGRFDGLGQNALFCAHFVGVIE